MSFAVGGSELGSGCAALLRLKVVVCVHFRMEVVQALFPKALAGLVLQFLHDLGQSCTHCFGERKDAECQLCNQLIHSSCSQHPDCCDTCAENTNNWCDICKMPADVDSFQCDRCGETMHLACTWVTENFDEIMHCGECWESVS